MLCGLGAVADIDESRGVLDVDDLDRELAIEALAFAHRATIGGRLDVLARDGRPLPVWRDGNVSYRQRAPDEHLLVLAALERVHANHAIFRAGNEEIVLCLISNPSFPGTVLQLTVAATARLFSWQSSTLTGSPLEPDS